MGCKTCKHSKPTEEINPFDLTLWCKHHKLFCPDDQRCDAYAYNRPPQRVRCSGCAEIYVETTSKYDPERIANGTMFRLTEKYGPNGYNWSCFPNDEWIQAETLECPDCGAPICDLAGKVPETALVDAAPQWTQTVAYSKEALESMKDSAHWLNQPIQEVQDGSKETEEKETIPTRSAGAEKGKEEKVVPPNNAHVCPECGKVCANQFGLIGHMRKHK
jgi:hypothetical protein